MNVVFILGLLCACDQCIARIRWCDIDHRPIDISWNWLYFLFHGSVFLFNFVSLQNQRKCQTFYLFIHLYFVFCDDDDILLHNLPICIILFETRVFLCAASDKTMSIQHRMHVVWSFGLISLFNFNSCRHFLWFLYIRRWVFFSVVRS